MARSFNTSKDYIAGMIGDTSGQFDTKIGNDYNRVYEDIWRMIYWSESVDFDYTFEGVADTAEYSLPSDFDKEMFVTNIATGKPLKPLKEAEFWRENSEDYASDTTDSGTTDSYIILREAGKIKLYPTPDTSETYAMPYKKQFTALTADADEPGIQGIDKIIELGALQIAYERKQLFSKADYYSQKYAIELNKRIAQERRTSNYRYQRVPAKRWYGRKTHRLTGDMSYDTI